MNQLNNIKFVMLCMVIVISYSISAQTLRMEYSTFIGGSGHDYGHAITVDDQGYAYIGGQVNSPNYPTTTGAFDRTANGGSDILVTKLNKDGSALVYSTYIGGSANDDTRKIFVDKHGCVYLAGSTQSTNFPITLNSLQGNSQGYFLKLDSTGSRLDYSSRWAGGLKAIVDSDGYLIILGRTNSTTFTTTENAFCRTPAGGYDVFVAKINIKNNSIIFSTLLGGSGDEMPWGMALDNQNNIIITGKTGSENYPVKGNTFASYTSGKSNVFVTKLKSDGTQLIYSTIIGGSDDEWPFDIAIDLNGNAYVTGATKSSDFPVSKPAFDTSYNGGEDAFLFKLSSDGSRLIYSTYIGGTDKDGGRGVVTDKSGRAFVTGCTRSTNFPITPDAFDKTFKGRGTEQWAWGDPFLLIMNPEGTKIEYSTYFGGSNDEEAYGIAMDKRGDVYLCGVTSSSDFPTTKGAFNKTLNGGCNIYVTKFSFSPKKQCKDR